MKRALKWLWDNADTIGIGCMWFVAAIDLVVRRKLDDACVWALFAIVCTVQNRHRAELNRLRIEANVTKELIGAIVTDLHDTRSSRCQRGMERPAKHHAGHTQSRHIRRLHRPRRSQGRADGLAHGRVLGEGRRASDWHPQGRRGYGRGAASYAVVRVPPPKKERA